MIDYGSNGSADTTRGYRGHSQVGVLDRPGETDVTLDVDFDAMKREAEREGAKCFVEEQVRGGGDGGPFYTGGNSTSLKHTNAHTNTRTRTRTFTRSIPPPQGKWLMSLGMGQRVQSVISDDRTTDEQAARIVGAMEMVCGEMGKMFKVMCVRGRVGAVGGVERGKPPGFT